MITTTYDFSSGSGFNYDATKIGFSDTSADLILLNNPLNFSENYASSAGFTFNSANTQFTGGMMRQINQAPATLAVYAAWDTFLNANYGSSTLTVTPFNGASVTANVLNLTGLTNKYVQLPSAYVIGNQGTIAFSYTPNYTGHPSTNQIMYGNSGSNNYFALFHAQSTGNFTLTISNSVGGTIANINFGVWSPTSGTTYVIVCQVDVTNGANKLFINGSQFGTTNTATGTRTLSSGAWVGSDGVPADSNSNFSSSGFALYSSVVGPSSLTPLPDYNYNADTISLPTFTYSGPGSILDWVLTIITDTNAPQYTINGLYWNGSAWVSSNNTFSQSNTGVIITENIASLPLSNTINIKVYWTNIAQTPMSTALFTLNYTGQIFSTSNPTLSPNVPLSMDQLSVFSDVHSATGSDAIQYYLLVGNTKYWWNGTAWATSDGTFVQSNTPDEIQTNSPTLPISLGSFVTPYALLHSATGATTPSLTSLTLTYNYFGQKPAGPNVCTVFGYIVDENNAVVPGATVSVTNPTTFSNQGLIEAQCIRKAITDSIGYFSMDLCETTTVSKQLTFSVLYPSTISNNVGNPPNQFTFGKVLIPNTPEVNIATFTFS